MTETKLTANLPEMTIELSHRALADGKGEELTLVVTALEGFAVPALAWPIVQALPPPGGRPSPAFLDPWSAFALWRGLAEASLAPWRAYWRAALGLGR